MGADEADRDVSFKRLTDEQKGILKQKRISGSRTVAQWLRLLSPMARYDVQQERVRSKALTRFTLVTLLFISGIFLFAFTESKLALLLPCAAVIGGVINMGMLLRSRRRDIADHLQEFVIPLLALLEDDISGPVLLNVDLRPSTAKEKKVGKEPPYRAGKYKVTETRYHDPWLEGTARLVDGSYLRWQVTDQVRRLRKRTMAGGKYKAKIKYKGRSVLDLHLKLPAGAYELLEHSPFAHEGKLRMKRKKHWHILRSRRKVKRDGWAKGQQPSPLSLEPFAEMIGALFQRAERPPGEAARRTPAAQGGL